MSKTIFKHFETLNAEHYAKQNEKKRKRTNTAVWLLWFVQKNIIVWSGLTRLFWRMTALIDNQNNILLANTRHWTTTQNKTRIYKNWIIFSRLFSWFVICVKLKNRLSFPFLFPVLTYFFSLFVCLLALLCSLFFYQILISLCVFNVFTESQILQIVRRKKKNSREK